MQPAAEQLFSRTLPVEMPAVRRCGATRRTELSDLVMIITIFANILLYYDIPCLLIFMPYYL